jgi:hypothetical protein
MILVLVAVLLMASLLCIGTARSVARRRRRWLPGWQGGVAQLVLALMQRAGLC